MLATPNREKKTNMKALLIAIPIFMAYTDDVQFFCKYFWALKWSFGVSNHSAESYCPVLGTRSEMDYSRTKQSKQVHALQVHAYTDKPFCSTC